MTHVQWTQEWCSYTQHNYYTPNIKGGFYKDLTTSDINSVGQISRPERYLSLYLSYDIVPNNGPETGVLFYDAGADQDDANYNAKRTSSNCTKLGTFEESLRELKKRFPGWWLWSTVPATWTSLPTSTTVLLTTSLIRELLTSSLKL